MLYVRIQSEDVNFNMLDTTEGGLLKSVEQLLSDVFIPTLRKINHGWGELASPQAQGVKQEFISSLESFVSVLVLAESDQLRKEADDLGPRAELDHWKKRMSRFNYLLDQLKTPDVTNEAKDNVKYLYSLERFCDPLYNSDPVTNQMITSCKAYITNNGSNSIWDQPQQVVTDKIKAAIRLNQEYQRCFHKTKEQLEQTPSQRKFDISEMYIFGKFDTFQRRLNKILEMFDTITTYSALQDSKIEGLETIATRFQVSVQYC
ncbi:hypothetical protein GOODEAATRI_019409 [Goodea atripinnis]|uniref:Dynein heavy chain tail domain-containing protein n=1 Tax=Goodea atripinnis TaxID=208336 RepID=A0ABV0NMK0_9TELE